MITNNDYVDISGHIDSINNQDNRVLEICSDFQSNLYSTNNLDDKYINFISNYLENFYDIVLNDDVRNDDLSNIVRKLQNHIVNNYDGDINNFLSNKGIQVKYKFANISYLVDFEIDSSNIVSIKSLDDNIITKTIPVYYTDSKGEVFRETAGLSPIKMLYQKDLWADETDVSEPDVAQIEATAASIEPGSFVCLDVEHWGIWSDTDNTIPKLETMAEAFAGAKDPSVKFGFYRLLPPTRLAEVMEPEIYSSGHTKWLDIIDQSQVIAEHLDVIFPSLYWHEKPETWNYSWIWYDWAEGMIEGARQFGKPIYPFIAPSYRGLYTTEALSLDLWGGMFNFLRDNADGAVVYYHVDDVLPLWALVVTAFMRGQG